MNKNIGFDYDGTIINTGKIKSQWIKENLNLVIPSWKTDKTSIFRELEKTYSEEKILKIYEKIKEFASYPPIFNSIPEIRGVKGILQSISEKDRIWIITTRSEKEIQQIYKRLNSMEVSINLENIVSLSSYSKKEKITKLKICKKNSIDIIIDDDERHLLNENNLSIKKILFKNGAPKNINFLEDNKKIITARNFKEIADYINSF